MTESSSLHITERFSPITMLYWKSLYMFLHFLSHISCDLLLFLAALEYIKVAKKETEKKTIKRQIDKTSQELRMLSSVTLNCHVTQIVMKPGSQLSKL